ncbi:MAG: VPGUxxT family thioredoxin-like (seleno)protein, type 2, partial [Bacteroidota bacterium]
NKPVLILFQEVPGCATCRNYGHNVLSNPLMTEAIENEFIPLAIFNNKKGKDLAILRKYKEPTWNNPVVRIVNAKGENIVKRVASDYSAKGLYRAMVKALENSGIPIPEYMKILGKELSYLRNPNIKEAHFKMYCFWTGEKQLGSNEGVLKTKAGFMNGEVVKVTYDSKKINKDDLERFAQANKMKPIKDNGNFVWAEKDEDYYLQHSRFKYLPLSEVQKTKINSALGSRKNAQRYLSPKQQKWFKKVGKSTSEVLFNKDFEKSWNKMIVSH